MNPTRRRFLAGLSALAVAPVLVACGSDESGSSTATSGGSTAGGAAEEAAFPATITHKYGETTVEAAPRRVVCVGLTEQDALIALGIVPVGVTYWFGDKELQGVYPWARDGLGDAELPTVLDSTNGIEIEKVAALAPDLIIGQYAGISDKEYELLSKIAPTVAQSGDYADYGMPWDEMAINIATAVGRPETMRGIIDDVTAQIVRAAADHPEFRGQTAAAITPYEGLFLYGPEDPRSRMLTDLGFDLPRLITEAEDSEFGVSVSAERTADLADIGVAVWLDLESDKTVKGLFEDTTAYDEGRWFDISKANGSYYVAHSFVTPLSIPYLLERYVPQLAAAADGDPRSVPPVVED
jgi:iron complex transport system substrate-binding protein